MHQLIVIYGLMDGQQIVRSVVNRLCDTNIEVIHFSMEWGRSEAFTDKFGRLEKMIKEKSKRGSVSLLGISAGGSAAILAYCRYPKLIHRVINVCGRLREGKNVFPALMSNQNHYPAFVESVRTCETAINKLSTTAQGKVLTLRPIYDEIVPISTMTVGSEQIIAMPLVEHVIATLLGIYFYRGRIKKFLLVPVVIPSPEGVPLGRNRMKSSPPASRCEASRAGNLSHHGFLNKIPPCVLRT